MKKQWLNTTFKIGLITGGMVLLYLLSDQLLIYHYFRFEYYLLAVTVVALTAGILLGNRHQRSKSPAVRENDLLDSLTSKELQVLELICQGKSNKEIAVINFVELSTVKTHINNIYGKLGVSNRKEAVKVYVHYAPGTNSTLSPPLVS